MSESTLELVINGEPRRVARGSTVADLLAQTQADLSGKRIAVERNGSIVPRSAHASTAVHEGDVLEIVMAVGGG